MSGMIAETGTMARRGSDNWHDDIWLYESRRSIERSLRRAHARRLAERARLHRRALRRRFALALAGVGAFALTGAQEAVTPAATPAAPATVERTCADVPGCRAALAHAHRALRWQKQERRYLTGQLRQRFATDSSTAISLAAVTLGAPEGLMRCIAWAESRMAPWAWNPSGATGLFQWMPVSWDSGRFARFPRTNPYANAMAAAAELAHGNTSPWRGDACVG